MKVQLIVVQGKPEGKMIPLLGPVFRIGRGETCHLRPNSEQVSREHAEFAVEGETLTIKDLGSRNGTLVNGKAISASCVLKDRDLVQVGPLTFAVSIQGTAAPSAKAAPAATAARPASPDDVATDDIDSWLVSDTKSPTPERPSGVYGGDTITIAAFKDNKVTKPEAAAPAPAPTPAPPPAKAPAPPPPKPPAPVRAPAPEPAPVDFNEVEYERLPEGDTQEEMPAFSDNDDDNAGESDENTPADEAPEEFIDESNPFYVKKAKAEEAAKPGAGKQVFKDTSDAASEILRKMMERRRGPK